MYLSAIKISARVFLVYISLRVFSACIQYVSLCILSWLALYQRLQNNKFRKWSIRQISSAYEVYVLFNSAYSYYTYCFSVNSSYFHSAYSVKVQNWFKILEWNFFLQLFNGHYCTSEVGIWLYRWTRNQPGINLIALAWTKKLFLHFLTIPGNNFKSE